MLKPTVKRGLMLDFIPDEIHGCAQISQNRVFALNDKKITDGEIVYLMTRELRIEDNWALIFAQQIAKEHNRALKILLKLSDKLYSKRQLEFMQPELKRLKENCEKHGINLEINGKLPTNTGAIIIDFNPIDFQNNLANEDCAVFEVDSHNIIPARFISDKQEFSAATLRRKIYSNIAAFLCEFPNLYDNSDSVAPKHLQAFIKNKLDLYTSEKNNPNIDATSSLSQYLHCGFISSQRIALEVLKSNSNRENKEAFLEELIVRKELADNFCLYNQNYKTLDAAPNWAKETLNAHRDDIRTYIYNLEEFKNGLTHDELWNTAQNGLLKTGKIHGYLRMYWAKKILEWSISTEFALNTAIYLNDEYAIDGNDPNGYVGILWSICGVHDRPFADRLTSGKIRYMSLNGCKKKFDVDKYCSIQNH